MPAVTTSDRLPTEPLMLTGAALEVFRLTTHLPMPRGNSPGSFSAGGYWRGRPRCRPGRLDHDHPGLWVLVEFTGRRDPADRRESSIDLVFARDGVERRLGFLAPRDLEMSRGLQL